MLGEAVGEFGNAKISLKHSVERSIFIPDDWELETCGHPGKDKFLGEAAHENAVDSSLLGAMSKANIDSEGIGQEEGRFDEAAEVAKDIQNNGEVVYTSTCSAPGIFERRIIAVGGDRDVSGAQMPYNAGHPLLCPTPVGSLLDNEEAGFWVHGFLPLLMADIILSTVSSNENCLSRCC